MYVCAVRLAMLCRIVPSCVRASSYIVRHFAGGSGVGAIRVRCVRYAETTTALITPIGEIHHWTETLHCDAHIVCGAARRPPCYSTVAQLAFSGDSVKASLIYPASSSTPSNTPLARTRLQLHARNYRSASLAVRSAPASSLNDVRVQGRDSFECCKRSHCFCLYGQSSVTCSPAPLAAARPRSHATWYATQHSTPHSAHCHCRHPHSSCHCPYRH